MASTCVEFCEQVNPEVLKESRRAQFRDANRIQSSILSRVEKRALTFLAERLPGWVNSDHLTALGFAGQIMAGLSYPLSANLLSANLSVGPDKHLVGHPWWLIAGIGFLAINWFGDSLDGTLARLRGRQRPRYGFYVDHMLDSVGSVFLMGGLALSGYMDARIAVGLLVGFLLLSIQSYLATYVVGEFRLSFWNFGPTELRILLAMGNLALLRWPRVLHSQYKLFDVGGAIGLAGMGAILAFFTVRNIARLYCEERLQ